MRTFQENVTIINYRSPFRDPADIEKRKLRTALKTIAVDADKPPRKTILSVQRNINKKTAVANPRFFHIFKVRKLNSFITAKRKTVTKQLILVLEACLGHRFILTCQQAL